MQKKASEPEGSEALIPVISLVALSCGDAETVSGGTRQHQNASSEASFRCSHSMVKTASSLFQFVAVCSSLFYLHSVSKMPANPWDQIWVTVFRVTWAVFLGHAGSRQTASSNLWGTWTLYSKGGQGREAPTNTLLVATMGPRSSTCTVRSEALSSQCPLPQKRFSAFRFSHKLSFRD